jgi:hypothetical protein
MLVVKMVMSRLEDGPGRGNDMDMVPQPYALAREEGQAVWFLDALLI